MLERELLGARTSERGVAEVRGATDDWEDRLGAKDDGRRNEEVAADGVVARVCTRCRFTRFETRDERF